MNKTLISIALATLAGLVHAQTTPAPTAVTTLPPNAQVTVAAAGVATAVPAKPGEINPYTSASKEDEIDQKIIDDLKRKKDMSSSKLQLQRDELEAIRIEVEKRKLLEALNPSKPVAPKAVSIKKPRPLPQVIYPAPGKNETPVLVGVVTVGAQRVAMFEFDGKAIRASVGSIVAGQPVVEITANSVKLGNTYLNIPGKKGYPTVALNDYQGPTERKAAAAALGQAAPANIAANQAQAIPVSASSSQPTLQGTNIPLINPKGASSTTNVFGLLPPPPPAVNK